MKKSIEIRSTDVTINDISSITDLMHNLFDQLKPAQIIHLSLTSKALHAAVIQYNLFLFQILFKSAYEDIHNKSINLYNTDYPAYSLKLNAKFLSLCQQHRRNFSKKVDFKTLFKLVQVIIHPEQFSAEKIRQVLLTDPKRLQLALQHPYYVNNLFNGLEHHPEITDPLIKLIWAIILGKKEIKEILNKQENKKIAYKIAFLVATYWGNFEVINLLKDNESINNTLMHSEFSDEDTAILRYFFINLEEFNFNSDSTSIKQTALALAARYNQTGIIDLLLEKTLTAAPPLNLDHHTKDYETPLLIAIKYGSVAAANKLIEYGANIQLEHPYTKDTPLIVAARFRREEVIIRLVEQFRKFPNKNFLDHRNNRGKTAFYEAVDNYYTVCESTMKILLNAGADGTIEDQNGKSPLGVLFQVSDLKVFEPIISHLMVATIRKIHSLTNLDVSLNTAKHLAIAKDIEPKNVNLVAKLAVQCGYSYLLNALLSQQKINYSDYLSLFNLALYSGHRQVIEIFISSPNTSIRELFRVWQEICFHPDLKTNLKKDTLRYLYFNLNFQARIFNFSDNTKKALFQKLSTQAQLLADIFQQIAPIMVLKNKQKDFITNINHTLLFSPFVMKESKRLKIADDLITLLCDPQNKLSNILDLEAKINKTKLKKQDRDFYSNILDFVKGQNYIQNEYDNDSEEITSIH